MSKYVKSPLNYTGGKYKLLPQILPLFPHDVDTFYDLFCGGCNVGVNIKANKIVCNDTEKHLINLMQQLKLIDSRQAIEVLEATISKYQLSKTNEEGFKKIRKDYNEGVKSWDMFYAMVTNAFNYQIRFNNKGEYNMPFGRNRSYFNPTLKKRFVKFVDKLKELNIEFISKDFRKIGTDSLSTEDFVYCDPPYLISCASYNEQNGWEEKDEYDLLDFLDTLNSKNIKFALSNVLEHKGSVNHILKEWSRKYKVHYLNQSYSNCNYQKKNKSSSSVEVLISNY